MSSQYPIFMKALTYQKAHELQNFSITLTEQSDPQVGPQDVLVNIRAFAINPVDTKVRKSRSAEKSPVILGWDAAGIVEAVGASVQNFKVGDEVFYAGDLMRDGAYAQKQAVDARLIALKPKSLSFVEAAALPLTALTAWEGLFERGIDYTKETKVLIIGGAGGVGSIATQLLKTKTQATVIATASRPETQAWCKKMGADFVMDHSKGILEELKKIKISEIDVVYSTTQTDQYLSILPQIIRPFGHFIVIDDPQTLNIKEFKQKAISTHWEFMFAKSKWNYKPETQGQILFEISKLVEQKKLVTTQGKVFKGLTAENIRVAHELIESGKAVGKISVEVE